MATKKTVRARPRQSPELAEAEMVRLLTKCHLLYRLVDACKGELTTRLRDADYHALLLVVDEVREDVYDLYEQAIAFDRAKDRAREVKRANRIIAGKEQPRTKEQEERAA